MKQLSSINHFFWKYRVRLLLGILFIVLSNYFKILTPQLTAYVVNSTVKKIANINTVSHTAANETKTDVVIRFMETHLDTRNFSEKILWSGIILLVLALISGFFMFLMRQTIIVMSRLIEYDQKNQVFAHYQQLDAGFYKVHNTGDLMNRISEDVSRVRMYTGPAIMYLINLVAVIGFSIYYMMKASPKLTLVALAPLPVLAITVYLVNAIIHKRSGYIQALLSDLTTNAQESYSGIRVIKSFVQEKAMLGFFTANSETYRQKVLNLAKTEAIYFPSMALLIGISTLLTVMVGGLDVIRGHSNVGTIAEFVMYIQMLTFPVSAIGFTAGMIQRAAASQKRINEFLVTKPLIADIPEKLSPALEGTIDFINVDFTYAHTGIHAVDHFSLTINKGQKVAIIGRTGSGKSTIAQLLLRMYDPQSGMILYDGIPLPKIDLETLRSQVSYVPQDVFLFSETVKNNIGFGVEKATETQVQHAAKQASIHNEILSFPEQYETIVGERGVTLSGGQKQRISIARALIKDPRIVIFDDCLSAVDARTEQEVLTNLNKYLSDKTAIIITHRIFSLLRFDKIIVLENGRIVEEGTHEALLQKNGVYTDMYNRQQQQETAS
jgi:ATP-binding cassette subfamily B multidrug efflux pump